MPEQPKLVTNLNGPLVKTAERLVSRMISKLRGVYSD